MSTHLNWQKMSAYSGGTPLAWRTVTRKVKMLPTSSWPARPSLWLSLASGMLPSFRSEENNRVIKNDQKKEKTYSCWRVNCSSLFITPAIHNFFFFFSFVKNPLTQQIKAPAFASFTRQSSTLDPPGTSAERVLWRREERLKIYE